MVLNPLYAIGVFLSFTFSQSGMVVRLWKLGHMQPGEKTMGLETKMECDPGGTMKIALGAFGALCTRNVTVILVTNRI
jgi:hypothetical protein